MMRRRDLLTGALALLVPAGACAQAGGIRPVYVMRHLHTPAGERDPDLTAEGRRAAAALAGLFEGKPLSAIYISDFRRTRATVAPLAAWREIEPKIYDPADTPGLLARVATEKGPVLVVGHSNTVPDIVEGLGGARPTPLAHEDFGDVWTVAGDKAGRERLVY